MSGELLKSESLKKKTAKSVEKFKSVKNVIKKESLEYKPPYCISERVIEYTDEAWDYMNDFNDISLGDL